jgi:hypothetical protein
MSDMERKDEEPEIEGHARRAGTNEEPAEDEDEFEAHIMKIPNVRMD